MLQRIFIQNYALIEKLDLTFDKGLSIVTGETGAGKSILLGALSLLLGNRADSTSLLDKSNKCIIEGWFNLNESTVKDFFTDNDLDFQMPVIIRRELSPEGKSRSFINDTPVNLSQLKQIGSLLVDVHSQHETLLLNNSLFQLSVVDAFAQITDDLTAYREQFSLYKKLTKQLAELQQSEKKAAADADYFRFQLDELLQANLIEGEQEKLETELTTLTHAEEIKSGLDQASLLVDSGDGNILSALGSLYNQLNSLSKYDSRIEEIRERIRNMQIELKDIAGEMEQVSAGVQYNAERIAVISDRLDMLNHLQNKHRVNSAKKLLDIQQEFTEKLDSIESLSHRIEELENETTALQTGLLKQATKISGKRDQAIALLEKTIKNLLADVALPHAVLKVEKITLTELNENGLDGIRFLFSANKGIAYQEISKVASGGELSRLMLCIKASVAKLVKLPTIIFDEIDTGISGETALKVAKLLHEMATRHQLIAITHLPQIAGRGDVHYFVYKEVIGKKTTTSVRKLSSEERVVEIAKMLSGEKPSAVALENARELLKLN